MGDPETLKIIRDPSTMKSRIFIGNLPPSGVEKKDIEDIFNQYGKIIAVALNRGFAFVQFDNDESANEAINNEAGRSLQGKRLDIKHAHRGKNKSPDRGGRERSPFDDNRGVMDERDRMIPPRGGRGGRGGGRGSGPGREMDWRDMDRRDVDRFDQGYPGPLGSGSRGRPAINDEPYPPTDYPLGKGPYGDGKMGGLLPPPRDPVATIDRTNDCEIIVVNKAITEYAEYIETRLKKVGMTVDLLFPNDDIPLGRVLANISGRGSLYAIIVTLLNEEHRSLTVNILHGQHQEHRNMPMEDAINLIQRNFELYLRGERGGFGASAFGPAFDRHPDSVQTLLNLLQQNRQLTVLQYDKVIRYLQEKRELQVKIELGESKSLPSTVNDPTIPPAKQAELQSRILNILNKSGASNSEPTPTPVPAPTQQWSGAGSGGGGGGGGSAASVGGGGAPPLLNDPTVQKALDNLIQGDLLRKFNANTPAPVPAPQPLFGAYGPGRKF